LRENVPFNRDASDTDLAGYLAVFAAQNLTGFYEIDKETRFHENVLFKSFPISAVIFSSSKNQHLKLFF
jgi:hypothetical protein